MYVLKIFDPVQPVIFFIPLFSTIQWLDSLSRILLTAISTKLINKMCVISIVFSQSQLFSRNISHSNCYFWDNWSCYCYGWMSVTFWIILQHYNYNYFITIIITLLLIITIITLFLMTLLVKNSQNPHSALGFLTCVFTCVVIAYFVVICTWWERG